jgi:hypothetical protein
MRFSSPGSVLLFSALCLSTALSWTAVSFASGASEMGTVLLDDSPDGQTGTPAWVAYNGTKEERWMTLFTPEYPGQDRTFNVSVYDDQNQRVGYYGLSPTTGDSVPVPPGGYVVVEDNMDKDDLDVTVGWVWND